MYGLPILISKGEKPSPIEIFNKKYRKRMGIFLLLISFISTAVLSGVVFVILPGIAIALALSQSVYLFLDKDLNPIESIELSYRITNGRKINLFFSYLLYVASIIIFLFILLAAIIIFNFYTELFFRPSPDLATTLFIYYSVMSVIIIKICLTGFYAYVYGELSKLVESKVNT